MIDIQKIRVKDVMSTPVFTINGNATVKEAAEFMIKNGCRGLVVEKVDEEDAYGIITVKDIVYKVIAKGLPLEKVRVLEIMTKPCITVPDFYDIKYAAKLMEMTGLVRLPVIRGEEIVGIITLRDIIKPFLKNF
ncbi:CBS domain-containing protein [Thermodesulfobacterium sp. TA1]|uniref:CBS domain-containing protein n=1 Tax=Thermodesulfobacterium sp. TA1 TaxID=2234087 RepID=UPI001232367B|nr:CBS domain-containing protein [Thermodesulfobacterium sp. TA1]QER41865.1 CBS domain-containing protein [Thermodesulfobacterium sp. TA1]